MSPDKELDNVAKEYPGVFQYLASKKRGRREPMRIAKIVRESHTTRERTLVLFRKLEAMQLGHIVYGPSGHPVKFAWKVNPVSVGRAAVSHTEIRGFNNRADPLPRIVKGQDSLIDLQVRYHGVIIEGPKDKVLAILAKL